MAKANKKAVKKTPGIGTATLKTPSSEKVKTKSLAKLKTKGVEKLKTKKLEKLKTKNAGNLKPQHLFKFKTDSSGALKIRGSGKNSPKVIPPSVGDVGGIRRAYREGVPARRLIINFWGIGLAEATTKVLIKGQSTISDEEWADALLLLLYTTAAVFRDDDSEDGAGYTDFEEFADWFYEQKLSAPQPM